MMNTINKSSPSFGAKFINNTNIKRFLRSTKEYVPAKVSFVEIDSYNREDIFALEDVARYWVNGKFATNFVTTAKWKTIGNGNNRKIYALTAQNKSHGKLNYDDILGLAEVCENSKHDIYLNYLQAKPDIIYSQNREYKGIGSGILNSLKNLYDKISLNSLCEKSVKNFYFKNNFKLTRPDVNQFEWHRGIMSYIKKFLGLN